MIEQRRNDDAEDDRRRHAEPRRQHQRKQLRLVADLRYRDDAEGYEECVHCYPTGLDLAGSITRSATARSFRWPKESCSDLSSRPMRAARRGGSSDWKNSKP